jgi:hypothetical protein
MLLDENGNAIQESTDFILADANGNTFPITAGTSTVTRTTPAGCTSVRIEAVSADIQVSRGGAGYKTVYAQSWLNFPTTPGKVITITRPNSTAVEGFYFYKEV